MSNLDPSIVPDLLHPAPMRRVAVEETTVAIALAFAGGTAGGLVSDALEQAPLAPSSWDPSSFSADLFLSRFVTECFRLRAGQSESPLCAAHLQRLLAQPPADPLVVEFRRGILRELVGSPELAGNLETLYRSLRRVRRLLENSSGERNWDPNRRQLDILVALRETVEMMASGFAGATSGLERLALYGARVRASEPYRSLVDLTSYDARLATLNLEVSVGADGHIRGFEVVSVRENAGNPFVTSPVRRWLAKLELFLRGYRFSDGEVLARLIDAVFTGIQSELVALVQLIGDLEFYLGALGFKDRAEQAGLAVCLPELVSPDQPRRFEGFFNPLLLLVGTPPVPCNLTTPRLAGTVLVTGPNSGGKTRLLQGLGLAQLLCQSGLFVPARRATLSLVPALVVSLIEETKADQAEGRLGMELMRIRDLFERLPPGAMVLLDELCSGTNPSEGEEIFELVVMTLARLKPQVFISTHFLAFAARLERERRIEGLSFLQVELGADRVATFQFVPGVAQSSLAGFTAARLGVTRDQLLTLVDRNIQRHNAGTLAIQGRG